ncbi:insulinase family protein, partial [Staphylococcus gallinarum]
RTKSIIEILNNNILLNEDLTEDMYIEGIEHVTREDVIKVAQATVLDTIYILTKGGSES